MLGRCAAWIAGSCEIWWVAVEQIVHDDHTPDRPGSRRYRIDTRAPARGSTQNRTSVLARPTGFEPARTQLEFRMIPIERAEQWDAALRNGS
jgi:hypothetical protein